MTIDLPSFIEKNYIGRAPGKTSPLACATTGDATLIQLHEPLAEHTHAEGGRVPLRDCRRRDGATGKDQQPLHAGVLLLVPRGTPHAVTVTGRNPLVMISINRDAHC